MSRTPYFFIRKSGIIKSAINDLATDYCTGVCLNIRSALYSSTTCSYDTSTVHIDNESFVEKCNVHPSAANSAKESTQQGRGWWPRENHIGTRKMGNKKYEDLDNPSFSSFVSCCSPKVALLLLLHSHVKHCIILRSTMLSPVYCPRRHFPFSLPEARLYGLSRAGEGAADTYIHILHIFIAYI